MISRSSESGECIGSCYVLLIIFPFPSSKLYFRVIEVTYPQQPALLPITSPQTVQENHDTRYVNAAFLCLPLLTCPGSVSFSTPITTLPTRQRMGNKQ